MQKLVIKWQRLIADGETCDRCSSTENELEKAVSELKEFLNNVEIDVVLEKEELTNKEFDKDPLASNKIWFNGEALEELVDINIGQSKCGGVCGSSECRTIEVEENTYETIPNDLIMKAGLKVATRMFSEEMVKNCCNAADTDNEHNCCC